MILLFDFDGVIIESNEVREFGFKEVLKMHSEEEVEKLLAYHNDNGGLSRYIKFEHFYKEIKKAEPTAEMIAKDAIAFSEIMRKELGKPKYLIPKTVQFLETKLENTEMYIVSGSDQEELRFLCKELGVAKFFNTIYGSPTHKNLLVERIVQKAPSATYVLVGDSINDYEAAKVNKLFFAGFNNESLRSKSDFYIEKYEAFETWLQSIESS